MVLPGGYLYNHNLETWGLPLTLHLSFPLWVHHQVWSTLTTPCLLNAATSPPSSLLAAADHAVVMSCLYYCRHFSPCTHSWFPPICSWPDSKNDLFIPQNCSFIYKPGGWVCFWRGNMREPCNDDLVLYLASMLIILSTVWCLNVARCYHWGKLHQG